jgi:hypothetical protein
LTEHSYDILERLNPDQMIGRGIKKNNYSLKDLKEKIKLYLIDNPHHCEIFGGAKTKNDLLNRIKYIKTL